MLLRTLFIDDSEDDTLLLTRELQRCGHTVESHRVENAAETAAALKQQIFDLILADYSLPNFSAPGALRLVHELRVDLPFIIVSGKINDEEAIAIMKAGAHDFIDKGHLARLGAAVERELREAATRRQARQAQESLRESEERYRAMVAHLPDYIVIYQDDRIVFANDETLQALGYTQDELAAMHPIQLVPPEEREAVLAKSALRLGGEGSAEYEMSLLAKNGEKLFAVVRGTRITYRNRYAGLLVLTNITERKKAEERHRKLEAQVQHAQRLESLGVLAGGLAHDFNNLLVGVLSNAEMALQDLSPETPVRARLEAIRTSAVRAAELTNQLLAYSGKGHFLVEPLRLNDLIDDIAKLLQVSISKKAALEFQLAGDLPLIEADASQLRQVVMNLIINASEALEDRPGTIRVRTEGVDAERELLAQTYLDDKLPPGRYVSLEVLDTGCGMSRETQARIFEPFFTTKFTGRGLGLAATLGIVRGHRGAIRVRSTPGRGTTFTILFPAAARQALPANAPTALSPKRACANETLLLVDDEETVRNVTKLLLEFAGYTVLTAKDGAESLELYRAHAKDIAAVILDMTMPLLSGEETLQELCRLNPGIRVVMISGYNINQSFEHLALKGRTAFLQKPFGRDLLYQKVREIIQS